MHPNDIQDVARWRRAERERLRAEREALDVGGRRAAANALADHLHQLLAQRFQGAVGQVMSGYWPIRGELGVLPLVTELHDRGVTVALPVVQGKGTPLLFRRWTPDTTMVRGVWNIPVPGPDAPAVYPDILLIPLLGWDPGGYRLGHGGGYYDRTLATLQPRPYTIGVGLQAARLDTIFPQPHDVPLDVIVTEAGVQVGREEP